MSKEFLYPSLVTILSLFLYFIFGMLVGRARDKYQVLAPQMTGNPEFERILRVHQNTSEQLLTYLPALWIFSVVIGPVWGSALGGLWIVGRIVYAVGYYKAAKKRAPGFAITSVATLLLLLGSVVGIVQQLLKRM